MFTSGSLRRKSCLSERCVAGKMEHVLIVFDFDSSLVSEDSDSLVLKTLAPDLYEEALFMYQDPKNSSYYLQWAALMNYCLNKLINERGVSLETIQATLYLMPVDLDIVQAIQSAVAGSTLGQKQVTLIIISDANEYYIETILTHLNIRHCFTRIFTNHSHLLFNEQTQQLNLLIESYQPETVPHHCPYCPMNLCKSLVLKKFCEESEVPYSQVIYIGDGSGDYCPAAHLTREKDLILCRENWSLHQKLVNSTIPICSQIIPWCDGKIIRETFERVLRTDLN
jgi:2,3-diketo-5-methylthio-1-phosphopentane phosphatase